MVTQVGVRVRIDPRAVAATDGDESTLRATRSAGYQVAKRAATVGNPPRRSNRGANSIRGSVSPDDIRVAVVSWSRRYYYMIFHEEGWQPKPNAPRIPGRHFLRRAFESYQQYRR